MTDKHGKTKDEGIEPSDERTEGEITGACRCCDDGACDFNTGGGVKRQSVEEKGS